MANMTINSLPQLSSNPHALVGGIALLTGSILFWLSLVWILVNIIRYFAARDKENRRFRLKRPLICFILSIVLGIIVPLLLR